MSEIQNSSFTILGAGRSGLAIAKLLKRWGAKVLLSDSNRAEKLRYLDTNLLDKEGIDYETGGHTERIYENEVFIKSPGIEMESDAVRGAIEKGKKVVSEIEAAYWFCEAPIAAVTGTNGKTTTTVLIGELLKNAGLNVKVCGNVGLAFSEIVPEVAKNWVIVLEVSSFQLESIEEFKPEVAVFLNFKEDHLDWHKTAANYMKAKMKITMNQDENDLFIYNADDGEIRNEIGSVKAEKAAFGIKTDKITTKRGCYLEGETIYFFEPGMTEKLIDKNEILIKGLHNVYNCMASVISAKRFMVSSDVIRDTLRTFKGVEHRIEFVRELKGVKFYNDSKATNVESAKMALMSFDKNIILIMGGYGQAKLEGLKDLIRDRVKKIVAVGDSAGFIEEKLGKIKETIVCSSFEEAVDEAYKESESGDTVLLSPAYKSFDLFNNFEERGKEFKRIVNSLK